jgi:hypothetical protein
MCRKRVPGIRVIERLLPLAGRRPAAAIGCARSARMTADAGTTRMLGLEAMLKAQQGRRAAPVEHWDPPYCGDIGLKIRADGIWLYRDSPILRLPLVKLFAGVLRRDADGKHYLVTPAERVDVAVEDAPFLAVEMEVRDAGRGQTLLVRTNLDDIVSIGAQHPLRFAIEPATWGLKPYVLVRGRLEARFTRALCYDLLELVIDDAAAGSPSAGGSGGDSAPGLYSGGVFFRLPGAAFAQA